MSNTRIAAAATALVLGATGLVACNDSDDASTDTVTTPTDGVVSEVSDAVTTDGATAGDTGTTGGVDATGDAVVSDTAVVSEDPLAPTDDAVISDGVVTNSIPADGAAGGAADDAAGGAATAPTN